MNKTRLIGAAIEITEVADDLKEALVPMMIRILSRLVDCLPWAPRRSTAGPVDGIVNHG